MSGALHPVDAVEDSIEVFLNPHARSGSAIYAATVTLICAGLTCLPIVRVGVSVQADGIIRPATEKHEIIAGVSGFVERVEARAHETVEAGQPLLRISVEPLSTRRGLVEQQLREVEALERDLALVAVVEDGTDLTGRFGTARISSEYRSLVRELEAIELRWQQARRELDRVRSLAGAGLAPASEVEAAEFAVERVEAERKAIAQDRRSAWRARLDEARSERLRLLERLSLIDEDSAHHVVRAPVSGTVEEIASVSAGSFVQAGQTMAIVSPDDDLIAEVYVSPADVGLLRTGTPTRLLIDAFNHSDWGHLPGRIEEIPDDFHLVNGRPVFRIVVALEATELTLPSGVSRGIRKGMTLRARFMVAERSLWQLLRDDVNDWLDPTQQPA